MRFYPRRSRMYRQREPERRKGLRIRDMAILLQDVYECLIQLLVCCGFVKVAFSYAIEEGKV